MEDRGWRGERCAIFYLLSSSASIRGGAELAPACRGDPHDPQCSRQGEHEVRPYWRGVDSTPRRAQHVQFAVAAEVVEAAFGGLPLGGAGGLGNLELVV